MVLAGVRRLGFIPDLGLSRVLVVFACGVVGETAEHHTDMAFLCVGMRICSLNIV